MTPEDLNKIITSLKAEMLPAVDAQIKVTVNGKLDKIDKKFDEYVVDDTAWKVGVDSFMTELMPVKDGLHMFQTMNKFVKWLGFPALGAVIYYFFTK